MPNADAMPPADLIRLARQVETHAELIRAALPHWDAIEDVLKAARHWPELKRKLLAAKKAPDDLLAAFHRAVFDDMAKNHGQTAAFWGALALEMGEGTRAKTAKVGRPKSNGSPESLALLEEVTALAQQDERPTGELAALLDADRQLVSRLRSGLAVREAKAGRPSRLGTDRLSQWREMITGSSS